MAERIAALFPENEDRVRKVIVGTLEGEINSWVQSLEGLKAEPGDRFVLVPVMFPAFVERPEGVSTRAKDLRFQQYDVPVIAVERYGHDEAIKPWVVKENLVNDLLLARLEPWCYAPGTQAEDYNINWARVSGGGFDLAQDVQKHGWVSAALSVTINIDSRR